MRPRTPIRILNNRVYVWVKNTGPAFPLNNNPCDIVEKGHFYLAPRAPKSIVLHEPWGKVHTCHMASPRPAS